MPITIGHSGNRAITEVYFRDGGVNRTIKEVWIGHSSGNRLVYSSAVPLSVSNTAPSGAGSRAQTLSDTTTASGGTGSYSGSWVSGGTGINASQSGSLFTFQSPAPGGSGPDVINSGTYRITSGAESVDIPVSFTHVGDA